MMFDLVHINPPHKLPGECDAHPLCGGLQYTVPKSTMLKSSQLPQWAMALVLLLYKVTLYNKNDYSYKN